MPQPPQHPLLLCFLDSIENGLECITALTSAETKNNILRRIEEVSTSILVNLMHTANITVEFNLIPIPYANSTSIPLNPPLSSSIGDPLDQVLNSESKKDQS